MPDKILILSKKAIHELIIVPEISSEAYYNKKLLSPIYPGGDSGVTIGLGYDLAYHSPLQIQKDLSGISSPTEIAIFQRYSGKKGYMCQQYIPQLKYIKFSWDKAVRLFYKKSLPKYCELAADTYPELETLHPYEQTAIVSIVYNRGAKTSDSQNDKLQRRKEMRLLIDAIRADDDNKMAALVRSMKRLWVGKNLDGLLTRYENLAHYIELLDIEIPEIDKLPIPV